MSITNNRLILIDSQPMSPPFDWRQTSVHWHHKDSQRNLKTHITITLQNIEQNSRYFRSVDIDPVRDQMTRSTIESPDFWFSATLLKRATGGKGRRSGYTILIVVKRKWYFVSIEDRTLSSWVGEKKKKTPLTLSSPSQQRESTLPNSNRIIKYSSPEPWMICIRSINTRRNIENLRQSAGRFRRESDDECTRAVTDCVDIWLPGTTSSQWDWAKLGREECRVRTE